MLPDKLFAVTNFTGFPENTHKADDLPFQNVSYMDIDDFKQINDSRGHQEGDRVLTEISKLILKAARDLDICSRYGGEEFAVILPQTGRQEALRLAERIRKRVENQFKKDLNVTISSGVATCPLNAKSAKALITRADKALYQSKSNGKNKVTFIQA